MVRNAIHLVLLSVLVPMSAYAQQPTPAFISVKEVEIRSGASDKFPATGKLLQNDRVLIKREANSGQSLEIVPPSGSFSWVREKHVQSGPPENGRETLVTTVDETELRAGADGKTEPLPHVTIKVKKGTKLIARGPKVNVAIEREAWWPVECLPDESRFIPASAIQKSTAPGSLPTLPPGGNGTKEPPQWSLADRAQREGRLDDAERLFLDIVRENAGTNGDFELSLRAQNRVREIRMQRRVNLTSRPSGGGSTLIPPTGVPAFTPPSDLLPPRPSLQASPTGMSRTTTSPANANARNSSAAGWLRRSGFQIDGKQTYALESNNGQLRVYVTAAPGVDLESHLNRPVEVFGSFEIRGDVRGAEYMRASRVMPIR